jgi:hypothetical protein
MYDLWRCYWVFPSTSIIGEVVHGINDTEYVLGRAVAEQLEGNEEQHLKYRQMVVDYLQVSMILNQPTVTSRLEKFIYGGIVLYHTLSVYITCYDVGSFIWHGNSDALNSHNISFLFMFLAFAAACLDSSLSCIIWFSTIHFSEYRSIEKISSHLWRMKFPLMTIARLCERDVLGPATWSYKLRHLSLGLISAFTRYEKHSPRFSF